MKSSHRTGILLAILAAALYAINSPFSKLLLDYIPSTLMAGLLYLGAGLGMAVVALIRRVRKTPRTEEPFARSDTPFVLAMILLDIAAPILLLLGLSMTTAATRPFSIILRSSPPPSSPCACSARPSLPACGVGSSSSPCPALCSPSRT